MRFAYIDSQGKEVGIPSVEALQLRIELGAIGEETMFFDASTEKWGPAKEHEIFRTLSREMKEKDEGGFVAPPPPTMLRMAFPGTTDAPEPDAPADEPPAPPPSAEEPPAQRPSSPWPDEPAEPEPTAPEVSAEEPTSGQADDAGEDESFDFGDLDLAEEDTGAEEETEPVAGADDSFGFGDFGTLDLEPAEEEPGPVEDELEPVAEAAGSSEDELEPVEDEVEPAEESSFDFGDGLEMDAPTLDEEEDEPAPAPGGMELEQPLSEYSPDEPPAWMDEEEDEGFSGDLELEDAATAAYSDPPAGSDGTSGGRGPSGDGGGDRPDGDAGDDERPRPQRRPPRARPARAAKKKAKVGGLLAILVLLAAVGVGGWFGWDYLQDRQAVAVPEEPVVPIPEIAAHLEPVLEEAAPQAYQATIDSLRAMSDELPEEPGNMWLSGAYLANPSRYEAIESYWEDLGTHLERMQEREEEVFMAEFEARLDSLEVEGEDRTALEERARAGFQAAGADRRVVYRQLDALVQASLDLHDFLLSNEDAIEYSPSRGGLSRDPVTEAVPASEELGREMWDRVGAITRALDALGALDRVNTDRIMGIVLDKLAAQSIR